ncbi:MAG: glycine cleavage system protein H [Asgard group archaeon]
MGQVGRYYYPDDVWIDISDPGHVWIKKIKDSRVKMGIDDFAAKNMEEIISIRTQKKGKELEKGKFFATVESGKWTGPLIIPLSGKIVEINPEISENPSIANEDPYDRGWLVIFEAKNLEEELNNDPNLVKGSEVEKLEKWIGVEEEKYL